MGRMPVAERNDASQDEAASRGTNSYSIVSKCSVLEQYEKGGRMPKFLRAFVPRPRRRAPLINRGYWLRMHVIESTVRQFLLRRTGARRKVVVNLGAGFDVLPFRINFQLQETGQLHGHLFIDVDYPKLMEEKVDILTTSNLFDGHLGAENTPLKPQSSDQHIVFSSM